MAKSFFFIKLTKHILIDKNVRKKVRNTVFSLSYTAIIKVLNTIKHDTIDVKCKAKYSWHETISTAHR